MRQDERGPFVTALRRAREAAYPSGGYVGQESFQQAEEIRRLARRAGIARDTAVLDLCCGTGGPGRLIAAETGCDYLGVDYSPSAVDIARALAGDLPCRYEIAHVPPLPCGPFEVVLLLETLLAFPDKRALLREVADALDPGGRFACTLEEGQPLTTAQRARMPDADTVFLVEHRDFTAALDEAGLTVTWQEDCSTSHQRTATALAQAFRADSAAIAGQLGPVALAELITAHDLWIEWLATGRVRTFALVAEKR
jgi:SAM-dependent methyltransferase